MAEAGSVLERLRAQRAASMAPKRKTLEVPGWSGMLHVRYKPIPWDDMTRLVSKAGDDASSKAALQANVDVVRSACDALLVKDGEELKSLADELRSQGENVHGEVRFDEYAKDFLGLEGEDGSFNVVMQVFGGAVSPELAIGEHAARIAEWMTGSSREADEELAGE